MTTWQSSYLRIADGSTCSFSNDQPGYTDAVFKFVQALAPSKMLVGGKKPPLTVETAKLKEQSYRWIWQIRNPQIRTEWSQRIKEILR